jgi:uncharacterized protein (TIGR00730 family)
MEWCEHSGYGVEPIESEAPSTGLRPTREFLDYIQQIKETADKLARDNASRGDIKLIASANRELRYAFKVFNKLRDRRKVTVFGSARTKPHEESYQAAVEFSRKMAEAGYYVITGAGNGIMEAGHVGAGKAQSIGINILLPFEQSANHIIQGDPKLMSMRYFFTRKLMFVKETDAVALFPGGFGTLDEGFEALTLIQTGKSHMFPIVLVNEPGGKFWDPLVDFFNNTLLARKLISPSDYAIYKMTDNLDEAVEEIVRFYRVYHSMRYVKEFLFLRLNRTLSEKTMSRIRSEFQSILVEGDFEITEAHPFEANETAIAHLPRLRFRFDRRKLGELRMLIDVINLDE